MKKYKYKRKHSWGVKQKYICWTLYKNDNNKAIFVFFTFDETTNASQQKSENAATRRIDLTYVYRDVHFDSWIIDFHKNRFSSS